MKKLLLLLLLTICLLVTVTACGREPTASIPAPTADEGSAVGAESPVLTKPADSVSPDTSAEPGEAGLPDEPTELPDLRGSWEGDIYTNERCGFRMALPEGWLRSNDYQLAQANYMISEDYMKKDAADLIQEKGQLYVLRMEDYKSSVVSLGIMPAVQSETLCEDTDVIWGLKETLTENIQEQGQTVKLYEAVPLQIGGQEKAALHMLLEQNGNEFEEYLIWFRKDPSYWGVMYFMAYNRLDLQPILDGISLLDPAE